MAENKNIKLTESSFEQALGKLDTLYSNLSTEKQTFESICADLLDGWDGKASEQASDVLESIKSKFAMCVSDFETIKKDMIVSQDDFNNSDRSIAEGIGEKTIIQK